MKTLVVPGQSLPHTRTHAQTHTHKELRTAEEGESKRKTLEEKGEDKEGGRGVKMWVSGVTFALPNEGK